MLYNSNMTIIAYLGNKYTTNFEKVKSNFIQQHFKSQAIIISTNLTVNW